jgi:hypothetical protein
METEIVFCERCGVSIPESDLSRVRQESGGRNLCANCVGPGRAVPDPAGLDGDLKLYFCENCRVSIAVSDVLTRTAKPEGPGYLCAVCSRSTPAEKVARRTAVDLEMAAIAGGPAGPGRPLPDPIYFCDTCNSSIPATFVATGRALVKAGRTYCERCRPRLEGESPRSRPGVGAAPVVAAALLAAAATAAGVVAWERWSEEDRRRDQDTGVQADLSTIRSDLRTARGAGETAMELSNRNDRALKDLERKMDGLRAEVIAARAAAEKAASQPSGADRIARLERQVSDVAESMKLLREDMAVLATERRTPPPAPEKTPPEPPAPEGGSGGKEPAPGSVSVPSGGKGGVPAPPGPQTQGKIALLDDKDSGVRFAAAIDLGKLGDVSAWPALAKKLHSDEDIFVRRACAQSIGDLRAYEAFPDLADALLDPEEFVAIQSHRVLQDWMKEDLRRQLGRDPTEKEVAARDFGFKQGQVKSERKRVADRAKKWWDENRDRVLAASKDR